MPMMRVFMHSCLVDFSLSFGFFNGALNFGNFLTAMLSHKDFLGKQLITSTYEMDSGSLSSCTTVQTSSD